MGKIESGVTRKMLAGVLAVSAGVCTGVLPSSIDAQQQTATATAKPREGVLKPADLANLMPPEVFFRGQSASVQMRNSAGIRYADGMLTMAALVDTSGYSSGIQQRYQAYLITEVPLQLGDSGHAVNLPPGAYGVGFIQNNRFVVMDLGAHELRNVGSQRDEILHRAMPLQVLDGSQADVYRLYEGRSYVTVRRAP